MEYYGECWYGMNDGVYEYDKNGVSINCESEVGKMHSLMVYRID